MSWDRLQSQQHFHNASRHTQDQVWVILPLAHPLYHSSCPSCLPTHPPGSLIGLCRAICCYSNSASSQSNRSMLGFRENAHWWVTSVVRPSHVLLVTLHSQAAQCMRLCANRYCMCAGTPPVELLSGESISNVHPISRHDQPSPHALLLHLPKVVPTCPCTRSRFTSGPLILFPHQCTACCCRARSLLHRPRQAMLLRCPLAR
jgi:hypothetical protein